MRILDYPKRVATLALNRSLREYLPRILVYAKHMTVVNRNAVKVREGSRAKFSNRPLNLEWLKFCLFGCFAF